MNCCIIDTKETKEEQRENKCYPYDDDIDLDDDEKWLCVSNELPEKITSLAKKVELLEVEKAEMEYTFPLLFKNLYNHCESIKNDIQDVEVKCNDISVEIEAICPHYAQLSEIVKPLAKKLCALEYQRRYFFILNEFELYTEEAKRLLDNNSSTKAILIPFSHLIKLEVNIDLEWKEFKKLFNERISYLSNALKNQASKTLERSIKSINWPKSIGSDLIEEKDIINEFKSSFSELIELQLYLFREEDMTDDYLWSMKYLIDPLLNRVSFHFSGDRPTNKLDKPEWFFAYLLELVDNHANFLDKYVQPLLNSAGVGNCDAQSRILRALVSSAKKKVQNILVSVVEDDYLFCHLVDEVIQFEKALQERDYSFWASTASAERWSRCIYAFTENEIYLNRWIEVDLKYAIERLQEITEDSLAWRPLNDTLNDVYEENVQITSKNQFLHADNNMFTTKSAEQTTALLYALTERFMFLPDLSHRLLFVNNLLKPLIQKYYFAAAILAKDTQVFTCIKDLQSEKWNKFCSVVNSCNYFLKVLKDWENSVNYVEIQQYATKKAQDSASKIKSTKQIMTSMVDSVSSQRLVANAISSVQSSSILAPSAIIGPSAALSAAYSSMKGVVGSKTMSKVLSRASAAAASMNIKISGSSEVESNEQDLENIEEIEKCMVEAVCEIADVDLGSTVLHDNNSCFQKEVSIFKSLIDAMLKDAVDAATSIFKSLTWSYSPSSTSSLVLSNPQLSPELLTGVYYLKDLLLSASEKLNSISFSSFWKSLLNELDNYLCQDKIFKTIFSPNDIEQLLVDYQAILQTFSSFSLNKELSFHQTTEAIKVLKMSKEKRNALLKELESTKEKQMVLKRFKLEYLQPKNILVLLTKISVA